MSLINYIPYRYISPVLANAIIKIVDIGWTRLDDCYAWGFIVQRALTEHEVDAGQLVTVDVSS